MGSCCVREPTKTPEERKEASESTSPIAISSDTVNSLKTTKVTSAPEPKTMKSSRMATPAKSFVKQFAWEQDLNAISIPAKKLTPVFGEMYELRIESRRGLLGSITIGTHKLTRIKRAIGKVERLGRADEDVKVDLEVLTGLSHPVLLKAETFLYNRKEICLLSENFTGAKIISYMQIAEKQSEALVKRLAFQLFGFVSYMHFQKKELKTLTLPQLLFYQCSSDEIAFKYTGLAEWKQPSTTKFILEQPWLYAAPEGTTGDAEKSVVWSCAVILHILLTNTVPFPGNSSEQVRESVAEGFNVTGKVWLQFDPKVKALISAMLAGDPRNRPTLLECLAHPWIQDYVLPLPSDLPTVMTNLRKFQGGNPIKLATLSFIMMNILTPEEKQPLANTFTYLNTSGKGEITLEELTSAFSKVNRTELSGSLATEVLRIVDINRNGSIGFAEFLLAAVDYQSLIKSKHLKTLFVLLEPDSNGLIALDDLKIMLRSWGEERIWQNWTKNAEGKLGIKDFMGLMQAILGEGRR